MRPILRRVQGFTCFFSLANLYRLHSLWRQCMYPAAVTLLGLALSSCGGGAGKMDAALTGRFIDSPVKGLRYSAPSHSGETGANGEFQYAAGETVTFAIGNVVIGQATGAAQITPFDLAGIAPPTSSAGIEFGQFRNKAANEAVNVAVLLQTLDADGDPSNGIVIPDQIHTLAAAAKINFRQSVSGFSQDRGFRKLVGDGRRAGLWGGARAIPRPAVALNALYAGLGLTPRIYARSSSEGKSNDGTLLSRATYTYDSNGNGSQSNFDYDADGIFDYRLLVNYDVNGNETVFERHDDNINIALRSRSFRVTTTYDANGNEVLSEFDFNFDGVADSRKTSKYDAGGYLTMTENDDNADDVVDSRTTNTYDANGNLTLAEVDSNGDGIVDSRTTNTYDASGNLTLAEVDSNGDGIVDSRTANTYDANGNLTLAEVDSNGDGIVDSRTTNTYDANGNLTLAEVDSNGDGIVERRLTFSYSANGINIRSETVNYSDGKVTSRFLSTYNANGNEVMNETDNNGDGVVDRRVVNIYDATGNKTLLEIDSDGDGILNFRTVLTYVLVKRWGGMSLFY
jgi:hypothetical protein